MEQIVIKRKDIFRLEGTGKMNNKNKMLSSKPSDNKLGIVY